MTTSPMQPNLTTLCIINDLSAHNLSVGTCHSFIAPHPCLRCDGSPASHRTNTKTNRSMLRFPLKYCSKPRYLFKDLYKHVSPAIPTSLFVTENFLASGGSLASHRGCDKLFKKPFIFHFNQRKSTLIKKSHCKLLNLYW